MKNSLKIAKLIICLFLSWTANAADLVSVKLVNSNYLQIQIKNTGASPLLVGPGTTATNYQISSNTDQNYASPLTVLTVSRKSKQWENSLNHWLYLQVPTPLEAGNSYTISIGAGTGISISNIEFSYNPEDNVTSSIHLNTIGYNPSAGLKFAYVYHWMGDLGQVDFSDYEGNEFKLLDIENGNNVAFRGKLKFRSVKSAAYAKDRFNNTMPEGLYGSDIWECDFSAFSQIGKYKLVIDGIGSSPVFRIDREVYKDLVKLTARGLYHFRSGPARTKAHTDWVKPQNHIPGVTNNGEYSIIYSNWKYTNGANAFTILPDYATAWEMPNNRAPWMNDNWGIGGYFDAGDYDKNLNHFRIAREILQIFELAPNAFKDKEYNIPESGNGIPDLLDEARWVIDFFRNLEGPTGGISGGLETTGHNGGPSWSEQRFDQWYAYAEEAKSTYLLAGAEAHLAYCLQLIGNTDELDTLTKSAKSHYEWAINENDDQDERAYAAAALFKLTGELRFLEDYKNYSKVKNPANGLTQEYATYLYVTTNRDNMDFTLKDTQSEAVKNWSYTQGLNSAAENACRVIRNPADLLWLGTSTTPKLLKHAVAHYLTRDPTILDYMYTTADYFNGGNAMNINWITGSESIGADLAVAQVLATDSKHIDGVEGPIPGIILYGIAINVAWTPGNQNQQESLYPPSNFGQPVKWPADEVYFENSGAVETNEFTIHQTMGPATASYAYLSIWENSSEVAITGLGFERDTISIPEGLQATPTLRLTPFNTTNSDIVYNIADTTIATASDEGAINALKAGQTFMVASVAGTSIRDTIFITVTPFQAVSSVEISVKDDTIVNDTITIEPNTLIELKAEVLPVTASIKTVEWQSSDSTVAYVDENGNCRSKKTGSAVLTATAHNKLTDSIVVMVTANNGIPGKIEMERYSISNDASSPTNTNLRTVPTEFDGTDYVGWLGKDDWAKYTLSVEDDNYYMVSANISSGSSGGTFSLEFGQRKIEIAVPFTGGWLNWKDIESKAPVFIKAEDSIMTFTVTSEGGFNINFVEFEIAQNFIPLQKVSFSEDNLEIEVGTTYKLQPVFLPIDATLQTGLWQFAGTGFFIDENGLLTADTIGMGTVSFISNQSPELSATLAVNAVKSEVLGINTSPMVNELQIFPNPSRDGKIFFNQNLIKDSRIMIYDLFGRLVHDFLNQSSSHWIELPLNFKNGYYFLHICQKNQPNVFRFILER